jgi:hypothetical protein
VIVFLKPSMTAPTSSRVAGGGGSRALAAENESWLREFDQPTESLTVAGAGAHPCTLSKPPALTRQRNIRPSYPWRADWADAWSYR